MYIYYIYIWKYKGIFVFYFVAFILSETTPNYVIFFILS